MPIRFAALLVPFALLGCAVPAVVPDASDDSPRGRLGSMVWMAGSWVGKLDDRLWEAHYTAPAGGRMLGMTKRYDKDGNVDFFEFESFHIAGDQVVAQPHVNGKPSVTFPMTSLDRKAHRAVFENPQHEPRTLDYWRVDADTLVIAVTAPIRGEVAEGAPKVQGFRVILKRR